MLWHPKTPCFQISFWTKITNLPPKGPIFFIFWQKNNKFVQKVQNFSQFQFLTCEKTHFVSNSSPKDLLFCVKSHFPPKDPGLFFVWFLPHQMPLTLKTGPYTHIHFKSVWVFLKVLTSILAFLMKQNVLFRNITLSYSKSLI